MARAKDKRAGWAWSSEEQNSERDAEARTCFLETLQPSLVPAHFRAIRCKSCPPEITFAFCTVIQERKHPPRPRRSPTWPTANRATTYGQLLCKFDSRVSQVTLWTFDGHRKTKDSDIRINKKVKRNPRVINHTTEEAKEVFHCERAAKLFSEYRLILGLALMVDDGIQRMLCTLRFIRRSEIAKSQETRFSGTFSFIAPHVLHGKPKTLPIETKFEY